MGKSNKDPGLFSCVQLVRYKGEEIPEADTPRQMEALTLQRIYLFHHWRAQQIVMGQFPARTLTTFTAGAQGIVTHSWIGLTDRS